MAEALLKLRIMPESLDVDLKSLKADIKESLEEKGAVVNSMEDEPVAFGLKAIIIMMSWPEEKGTDRAEEACQLKNVKSVETVDFRRALG